MSRLLIIPLLSTSPFPITGLGVGVGKIDGVGVGNVDGFGLLVGVATVVADEIFIARSSVKEEIFKVKTPEAFELVFWVFILPPV